MSQTTTQELESPSVNWPIYLVSGFILLSGLVGTIQPLFARISQHPKFFNILVRYDLFHLSKSLTVIIGYMLIFLSINLIARKKMAWYVALSLSIFSASLQIARIGSEHIHWLKDTQLGKELPDYSALPSLISIALLIATRKRFTVASRTYNIKDVSRFAFASLLSVIAYGTIGFFLLDPRDFGLNFEFSESVIRTLRELTLLGNDDLTAHTKFGKWFIESLRLYGIFAATGIAYSAFLPVRYRLLTLPKEREAASAILDKYGFAALDIFKLDRDKSFFFNSKRTCFVAYRAALGVAIALGDINGPPEDLEEALREYRTYCHNNGWKIAFLQTTPKLLELYHKCQLKALKVGEDGIVDIETFVTKTITKKTFKSVIKKFDKEGYTLTRHAPPHSQSLLTVLKDISDQWLSLPGRRERGFTLGQYDVEALQANNVYLMRDPAGKPIAFVNEIRSYGPGETTIDMMRHVEGAPNGTMDFLFGKLLIDLKERGFTKFSLGLAALSGVGDAPEDSLHEKAMHQVYEHMNRFFSYKGLRAYKAKFDPSWEDRFLIYEGGTPGLVKTGLAIARVTEELTTEDFIGQDDI